MYKDYPTFLMGKLHQYSFDTEHPVDSHDDEPDMHVGLLRCVYCNKSFEDYEEHLRPTNKNNKNAQLINSNLIKWNNYTVDCLETLECGNLDRTGNYIGGVWNDLTPEYFDMWNNMLKRLTKDNGYYMFGNDDNISIYCFEY